MRKVNEPQTFELPSDPRTRLKILMLLKGCKSFGALAKEIRCSAGTIKGMVSGNSFSPGVARRVEVYFGVPIFAKRAEKAPIEANAVEPETAES